MFLAIKCKAKSIYDIEPPEQTISPLSINMRSQSRRMEGKSRLNKSALRQCVVATLPFSKPQEANKKLPVQ